jgi:Na+-driven multidrug efflux pump
MDIKPDKALSVFLWLVALHSLLVGIGLIFLPSSFFEFLGFQKTFDRFFSTQGGVFHIAMSVGYAMAAKDLSKYKQLIVFTIIIKFIATVFLLSYFFVVSQQWLIITSGISDFVMGYVVVYLYKKMNERSYFDKKQL